MEWLPQRKAEDPAAVLVAAITEDWAPPPAVLKTRRKEKQQAEKQAQARTLRQRQAEAQARARAEADRQDACWQQLPHEERQRIEVDLKARLRAENPFLGQRMEGRPDSPAVVKLLEQMRRQYLAERFPAPPADP
ncbi:MAG: hypothetical protein IT210_25605 [Armatimonadetes bacterium]|nr:hypothetical protein [Armatimonadota bacterium]